MSLSFSKHIFHLLYFIYSPILAVVPIEFASEAVAIEMAVDYHGEHHSIATKVLQLDQLIPDPMAKVQTNRSMNLNACLNDVDVDLPMHGLNVAYDEHLHDESQMAHRIYSVKEI